MNKTLGYCLVIGLAAVGFLWPDTLPGAVCAHVMAALLLRFIDRLISDR